MFEYISGGGLVDQALPASLLAEGAMMLQALLSELKSLEGIELYVPLDSRCHLSFELSDQERLLVSQGQNVMEMLPTWLADVDLFWPIAPESDGILQSLAEMAAQCQVEVLLSDVDSIKLCADKYATYLELSKHRLPLVETRLLSDDPAGLTAEVVVKIADGAGCQDSFVVHVDQLATAVAGLSPPQRYIVQPYRRGQAASLSCLFKDGQAWLLCCNQQQVSLQQGRFRLQACRVNVENPKRHFYRHLISAIAEALPGLWGYVGIDIIETAEVGPLLLEINPRLTSSYVGIRQATGINVAEQVLRLRQGLPDIQITDQQTFTVNIDQGALCALS